jgi:acyl-CoA hydrolase
MTQIVLPGDANALGTAFGGKIMQWIDVAAGVAARRHAGTVAVTASMDSLQFHRPVRLGDVVVLRASVNRAWRTSMEIGVRVVYETDGSDEPVHAASAYLTFVAVDRAGQPQPVPPLQPETDEDRRRYAAAERRRSARGGTRTEG